MADHGPLSKYFFDAFLKFQKDTGQIQSISDFAKAVGVSQSYVSQILSADRKKISRRVADQVYTLTGDAEIYEITGYPRPDDRLIRLRKLEREIPPDKIDDLLKLIDDFVEKYGYSRKK